MATVSFYISRPNRKKEFLIFLTYQSKGKKFRYYTNFKIKKEEWNSTTHKIKQSSPLADINNNLRTMENTIQNIEAEALRNGIGIDLEYIKKKFIESQIKNKAVSLEPSASNRSEFFTYFDQYIEVSKTTKTQNSIIQIKITCSKLEEFEKFCKYKLSFNSINADFYKKFQSYLIDEQNLLNNSVGKYIKTLKAFMNYCTDIEVNTNIAYKKFKVLIEDIEIIYLTESELLKLYKLDIATELSKSEEANTKKLSVKTLSKVRDIFCFACFTGLRYSDIHNLTYDQIKDDYLIIRTIKTKDILTVPLVNYAKEILNKYNFDGNKMLPKIISNQKMNEYIKEVCKLAKIDEMTKTVSYSGSKKIEKLKPKYDFISFHSARRTFITLALEKGMRAEVIMQISGHKNYQTFKKYIKITDKVKKDELNRIWN